MGDFTYEIKDRREVLETYEWDNVWIDCANDTEKKRVLYIGDSISCGTRRTATALSGETVLFDGFGTSKAVDNPFFTDSIRLFAAQLPKLETILFNNGLHGFHLEDDTEYKEAYEKVVAFLLDTYPDVPVYILLTTCVRDEVRLERVKVRNRAAREIAEKYGLPVVDLFALTEENKSLLSEDGVHFTSEGYERIAKEILTTLKK